MVTGGRCGISSLGRRRLQGNVSQSLTKAEPLFNQVKVRDGNGHGKDKRTKEKALLI